MQEMFCWRCQMNIPMLDEDEFEYVMQYHPSSQQTEPFRPLDGRFQLMLQKYREVTGFEETNANAIWHHRIALYGPPCENCRKPLRSPAAVFCAACGLVRN